MEVIYQRYRITEKTIEIVDEGVSTIFMEPSREKYGNRTGNMHDRCSQV